jgi:SAM-dependent methyltransferase
VPPQETTLTEHSRIEVRWLRFAEAREAILELRRRVFVEEQGLPPAVIEGPRDPGGIHLGAFDGDLLVAGISAYLYEPQAPELAELGLAPVPGLSIQFTKRIELASHRGHGITELLGASAMRYVYESVRPLRVFLTLKGVHRGLQEHYRKVFGFRFHREIGAGDDSTIVMTIEGERDLRALYLRMRGMAEGAARRCPAVVPSLVRFLAEEGRPELLAAKGLAQENLYVGPLSLADELPRLAAQNRLLFAEQRPRLASTPFPRGPASLLDVGTGSGVYLALVATEPRLEGYTVRGLEPSPQLLAYARFAFPEIGFVQATAYETGEPDGAHDVVTANFVFIHLRNPDLALLELVRVLRPGGLLYVVDVNDTTFRGPDVIRKMVEAHHACHEGDRRILASLPRRAREFGLEPVAKFASTVRNTGGVEPSFAPDEVRLGRMQMWGMLAFMGQREELEEQFQAAQEHYLGSECEISLDIETHVYRKPGGA